MDNPTKPTQAYKEAVEKMVNSLSAIPYSWTEKITDMPLPMWGTLWLANENTTFINQNLTEDNRCEYAKENDDCPLYNAGWREIADTGIFATHIDDELVLGINGAGYDFYEAHWSKLYDVLGYTWHQHSRIAGDAAEMLSILEMMHVCTDNDICKECDKRISAMLTKYAHG